MFCREGYVSIYDSYFAFDAIAEKWWRERWREIQEVEHPPIPEDRGSFIIDTGLGSGLIEFQSQKITVAARAMAERKTLGHRS